MLDIPRFEIAKGEQVALIGQSGGGKTTLLHLIAGLLVPDSGSIRIDGTELTRLSEQGRDRFRAGSIGYVFQTFNLLPAFSAIENVKLGMTFRPRSPRHRAGQAICSPGLDWRTEPTIGRANYRLGSSSELRSPVHWLENPKLLLADEPTANVDPVSAESVLELIRTTCREEHVSLLMVTHDMEIASSFDRVEKLDEINRVFRSIHAA